MRGSIPPDFENFEPFLLLSVTFEGNFGSFGGGGYFRKKSHMDVPAEPQLSPTVYHF